VDPTAVEAAWHRGGRGGGAGTQCGPSGSRRGVGVDPTVVDAVRRQGVGTPHEMVAAK
jgi:hypothetical protein